MHCIVYLTPLISLRYLVCLQTPDTYGSDPRRGSEIPYAINVLHRCVHDNIGIMKENIPNDI